MLDVVLLPEAVTDVATGYDWYEGQEPGLGDEFLRCLESAYASIAAHPLHYPTWCIFGTRGSLTPGELARKLDDRDPAHWVSLDQLKENWKE